VTGVHGVHVVPGDAGDRLALGQRLGQLDLDRVDAGDVVDDHADLAAVVGHRSGPLRVGEGGRVGEERRGAGFQAFGEGLPA